MASLVDHSNTVGQVEDLLTESEGDETDEATTVRGEGYVDRV